MHLERIESLTVSPRIVTLNDVIKHKLISVYDTSDDE